MASSASEAFSSCLRSMPLTILALNFVGFLAEFLQEAAGLLGDVDALDAPVDRIGLAYHEAGGL
jgi:hypothetical protein